MFLIVPDASVVWIVACCQAQSSGNTDGAVGDTVGESDAFGGDAIHVRRFQPSATASHGIRALLVCDEEENIGFCHVGSFGEKCLQWRIRVIK